MKKYLFISLFVIVIASCHAGKNIEKSNPAPVVKEITFNKDISPEENPAFTIKQAGIKGSTLVISIEYTGCEKDDFVLVFSGRYKKSLPLQVGLFLKRAREQGTGEQNKCRQIINKELRFNVSKIKKENNNTIMINLKLYARQLVYEY